MLPGIVRGQRAGSIGKSGLKLVPTATCSICGCAHSYAGTKAAALPLSAPCSTCLELLESHTGLKAKDGRYAFIASPKFPTGKVIVIENADMDRVDERLRHDLHTEAVKRVLALTGLPQLDGGTGTQQAEAWEQLRADGHTALLAKDCDCTKEKSK